MRQAATIRPGARALSSRPRNLDICNNHDFPKELQSSLPGRTGFWSSAVTWAVLPARARPAGQPGRPAPARLAGQPVRPAPARPAGQPVRPAPARPGQQPSVAMFPAENSAPGASPAQRAVPQRAVPQRAAA
jgi:hypothetical protein